jgi:hypothetical protein
MYLPRFILNKRRFSRIDLLVDNFSTHATAAEHQNKWGQKVNSDDKKNMQNHI